MSQNIKGVIESSKHFIVLDAISRGVGEDIDNIAKVTKISKAEIEMILDDLAVQRLIIAKQREWSFLTKRLRRA
jgi:hypothetical protein